ncbi:MAG: zf-HC2 domain-containing protein [Acidobacteriota bacterium]
MNQDSSQIHPASAADPGAAHPTAEDWIAYYDGRLADDEQTRLQDHLTQCHRCVELVLDLDRFAEPSQSEPAEVSEFEQAAVWRALVPSLGIPHPEPATRHRQTYLALAATLLFAVLGFTTWSQQRSAIGALEARVANLSQPRGNVVIRDLNPHSRQRSAQGAEATTELPADDRPITLILNLEEPTAHPAHRVRVLDEQGSTIREISGLEPSEFGNFYLALPPGALPAGRYELQLVGLSSGEEDLLEVYPIALQ